jgi:hypothetical protein
MFPKQTPLVLGSNHAVLVVVDFTSDRLLFNVLWTDWVCLGRRLEQIDLVSDFGDVNEKLAHYNRFVFIKARAQTLTLTGRFQWHLISSGAIDRRPFAADSKWTRTLFPRTWKKPGSAMWARQPE